MQYSAASMHFLHPTFTSSTLSVICTGACGPSEKLSLALVPCLYILRMIVMPAYCCVSWITVLSRLTSMLVPRLNAHNLRGLRKLSLPRVRTTSYGLNSVRYTAAKAWNKITDDARAAESLRSFKSHVKVFKL